jgi:membrane associated rhomboid family serine protease
MIPLGDQDVRGAGPGIVNWLLVGINVLVWLLMVTLSPQEAQEFFLTFGAVPVEILRGQNLFTLITSVFLHGGWLHIISNMLFLAIFGDNIEVTIGHGWYLLFYLAGGIIASLTHIFLYPDSTIPMVGASGAIGAVLGAYVIMYPRSRVRVFIFPFIVTRIAAVFFLGFWFIIQLYTGVGAIGQTAETNGVAVWAHVGGFVFGMLVGILFRGMRRTLERRR